MTVSISTDPALEDLEIQLLLEGIYRRYGYDFRNYSPASLRRRVRERVRAEQAGTVSGLHARVLHDAAAMERLLVGLCVNVSAMFRSPSFFRVFRERCVPLLRTYPFIRIWHAGCSGGEEVYSMAILLHEEGLYERCRLYATDLNDAVLRPAREGVFPLAAMHSYAANYQQAGGTASLSHYYTAHGDRAVVRPFLQRNLIFAQHNLATDGPFNEFHVIMCRNVLIYFNHTLQGRVHDLFLHSLMRFGFLGLGSKETLATMEHAPWYTQVDPAEKLYRRIA